VGRSESRWLRAEKRNPDEPRSPVLERRDPANPGKVSASVNKLDPNYKANHDQEFIAGVDRELIPNLSVGAAFTYHRSVDIPNWTPRIGLTSANYSPGVIASANGLSAQAFIPDQALVDASGSGRLLSNRPEYHTAFKGLELTLNKRLSNKWMTRVGFSYNNWQEFYDGPGAVQNPTRTDTAANSAGALVLSGPQVSGGQVAPRSGGSGKGDVFYNAKWQFNAVGLYQLPMGFDVAANVFSR
jgi:hypothetical protein